MSWPTFATRIAKFQFVLFYEFKLIKIKQELYYVLVRSIGVMFNTHMNYKLKSTFLIL